MRPSVQRSGLPGLLSIVTILAFVYVPLNLATSIFGMNIQELNGNGRNIWIFILTALIALLITGGFWFLIEVVNALPVWRQERSSSTKIPGSGPSFSIGFRVIMIVWLVWTRHVRWLWTSGALYCILTNDLYGPIKMPLPLIHSEDGVTKFESTGRYVTFYSQYIGDPYNEGYAFDYRIWTLDDSHDVWTRFISLSRVSQSVREQ